MNNVSDINIIADTLCKGGMINWMTDPDLVIQRGCYSFIETELIGNVKWIGGVAIALGLLMVILSLETFVTFFN